MDQVSQHIEELLNRSPYSLEPLDKHGILFDLLRRQVEKAVQHSVHYANFVANYPVPLDKAETIADLPYLPVSVFKKDPPLMLISSSKVQRILLSSSTTGQEPSRIAVDSITARRMSKGITSILSDFVGTARRPYLVVDLSSTNIKGSNLGARGAAIRGLSPFSTKTVYCMKEESVSAAELDIDILLSFANEHRNEQVLIFGFTNILWTHFVTPLEKKGICLNMPLVHVVHSGGWKKLIKEAVSKEEFNKRLSGVVGCDTKFIIDFYGMVENLGIIYPDCKEGFKHPPAFGEVIIRDPLTLAPVQPGEIGIVEVCSALPNSFPGHLLLTEDMATVLLDDGCPCGRRGLAFRFAGRIPKSENRGCGNVTSKVTLGTS